MKSNQSENNQAAPQSGCRAFFDTSPDRPQGMNARGQDPFARSRSANTAAAVALDCAAVAVNRAAVVPNRAAVAVNRAAVAVNRAADAVNRVAVAVNRAAEEPNVAVAPEMQLRRSEEESSPVSDIEEAELAQAIAASLVRYSDVAGGSQSVAGGSQSAADDHFEARLMAQRQRDDAALARELHHEMNGDFTGGTQSSNFPAGNAALRRQQQLRERDARSRQRLAALRARNVASPRVASSQSLFSGANAARAAHALGGAFTPGGK